MKPHKIIIFKGVPGKAGRPKNPKGVAALCRSALEDLKENGNYVRVPVGNLSLSTLRSTMYREAVNARMDIETTVVEGEILIFLTKKEIQ